MSHWTFIALLAILTACSSQPKDARIQGDDLDVMADKMAASIAASPAFRDRTPESAPMVISIQKVENLTDQVMTEGEQWGVIAKIRGSLPIQALRQQKNITFVMPRERVLALQRGGNT